MSDPVEILLVGCGRMGTGHLQAIRGLPGLGGVVAGVDPSEAAREHVQREFGVERTYADLDEAWRQKRLRLFSSARQTTCMRPMRSRRWRPVAMSSWRNRWR